MTRVVENKVQMKKHKFEQTMKTLRPRITAAGAARQNHPPDPRAPVSQVGHGSHCERQSIPTAPAPCAPPQTELQKQASPTGASTKGRGKLVCQLKFPVVKHPLAPHPSQHLPSVPSVLSIPATDPGALWFNSACFN